MRLELISDSERLPVEFGESTIFVKRITTLQMREIIEAEQNAEGAEAELPANVRIAEAAAVDWSGVCCDGEEVPFDRSLIRTLPFEVVATLYAKAMGVAKLDLPNEDEAIKTDEEVEAEKKT